MKKGTGKILRVYKISLEMEVFVKMKQYHEVALIKDGNEHVGYVLKEGGVTALSPYKAFPMSSFNKYVQAGKVQYFQWVNGKAVVKYTDEELATLHPGMAFVGAEYNKNDISYKASHMKALLQEGKGIFKLMSVIAIPGIGNILACMLYAPKPVIPKFISLMGLDRSNTLVSNSSKCGGNWVSFSIPEEGFRQSEITAIKQLFSIDSTELFKQRSWKMPMQVVDVKVLNKIVSKFE